MNYYHRHFQDFADRFEPLHNLLRKGVKWEWQEQEKNAFEKAKKIPDETNLLIHDPEKPLLLACDASPCGLGAVLSHQMPDDSEKPITFASTTLSKAERNYSQIEKEAVAIVYTVKMFCQYLFGRHFLLYADHKPLLGLLSEQKGIPSMAVACIQWWAILLSAYNYSLKYCSGSENSNADFFSHSPSNEKNSSSSVKNKVFMTELIHAPVTSKEIGEVSKKDPIISNVIDFILCGWPSKLKEQLKPYFCCRNELAVESSCLKWGNNVVIPFQLREKILIELHENHPGIVRMKLLACSYVWWPNIDSEIEMTMKSCKSCQINQAMLARAPVHPW